MEQQLNLFPEVQPTEKPVDTDSIARHISDNAPRIDYNRQPSDAAIDQGWGIPPVTSPETTLATSPRATKRLFELPSQGKKNSQDITPRKVEVQRNKTDDEIDEWAEKYRPAVEAARITLSKTLRP